MPVVAHALFYGAYMALAIAVSAALLNVGGATPGASVLGGLCLFAACAVTHAAFTTLGATGAVKRAEKRLRGEIDKLRAIQREVTEDVEAVAERLDRLDHAVAEIAHARADYAALPAPQPASDVRAIEALVDRLGRSLDARFEEIKRVAAQPAALAAAAPTAGPIDLVRDALNENRVELHLQPIVSLPQRRPIFYEGFSRLKDAAGRIIAPAEFMPAAEAAGLVSWVDNVLLFRAVQIVRKLAKQDRRVAIFCNISPRSLSDEQFFPQFLDFLYENRDMASAVIFELPQTAFEERTAVHARAMGRLGDLGFRFSLDHVDRLDLDLPDLERSGVRFVKVAGPKLVDQLARQGVRPKSNIAREIDAADVAAVFRRYGIDLIAERVEDEGLAAEIVDLEIPYSQGHLFGAPRPIKESLMEETAPPPGFFSQQQQQQQRV